MTQADHDASTGDVATAVAVQDSGGAAVWSSYRAWLIDLDGTLYAPLPVKLMMALELVFAGPRRIAVISAFRSAHEHIRRSSFHDEGSPFAAQLAIAQQQTGEHADFIRATIDSWMFERPGKWIALFRRRRLIREISRYVEQGGKCALVSDYPASKKLRALGCEALFSAVVANGEPGGPNQLKPVPEGYLLAARTLGVVPRECLVIGDRSDADGEAARRANMSFRKV